MAKQSNVTVVLPIYADWPAVERCLDSLFKYLAPAHQVLILNDSGPEADMLEKNIKAAIKGHANFHYYRNPKNLGFVGTCNRAVLELDKTGNDILLLNSDTAVTEGFLEEMLEVLYAKPNHGAVSPRSNNASLATVPLSASHKGGLQPVESFKIFAAIKSQLPAYSQAPTAHGFCMLIKRSLIKRFGLFDEAFNPGYGEEVDFCQRLAAAGYLSLIANRAFVYHFEAASFGSQQKRKLIADHSRLIKQRWPKFDRQLHDYITSSISLEKQAEQAAGLSQKSLKAVIQRRPALYKLARKIRRLSDRK